MQPKLSILIREGWNPETMIKISGVMYDHLDSDKLGCCVMGAAGIAADKSMLDTGVRHTRPIIEMLQFVTGIPYDAPAPEWLMQITGSIEGFKGAGFDFAPDGSIWRELMRANDFTDITPLELAQMLEDSGY